MNLFQQFLTAYQIWQKWGALATTANAIVTELQALDGGKLSDEVEAIFLKHGINLRALIASLTTEATSQSNIPTGPFMGSGPLGTSDNVGQGANIDPLSRAGRQ
jgi:hypothetical protein